jgi:hypothetical protein
MSCKCSFKMQRASALLAFLVLAATTVAIVPGVAYGQSSTSLLSDPVKTDAGLVSGDTIGDPGKPVRIYRGIPYAAPPVGDFRWKPPQPEAPWTGVKEATKFTP